MATTRQTITAADGWVQVAADGVDFTVENLGPAPVRLHYGPTPGSESDYHTIPAPLSGQASYLLIRSASGAAHVSCAGTATVVYS